MDPATFYRAVSDLLKCGDLVNEGTDKRPFYKVAGSESVHPCPPLFSHRPHLFCSPPCL